MPTITINEQDRTLYGVSGISTDNIVYIPGPAITGPYDEPVLLGSRKELVSTFGPYAPENSLAWTMASGLLLVGLPVLYQRVAQERMNTDPDSLMIKVASCDIVDDWDSSNPTTIARVEDKYGGSYGNGISVSVEALDNAIYIKLYRDSKLIENCKLVDISTSMTQAQIDAAALKAVKTYNFVSINFVVLDEAKFTLRSTFEPQKLTGGADMNDADVTDQIPYCFPKVEDKMVYDVKFLTSGGYTDTQASQLTIANAMEKLASDRGDCTAIVDMPLGIPMEDAGSFFASLDSSYATAYAPWCNITLLDKSTCWMPPSYIFLYTLGKNLASGGMLWEPPAGITRASVPEIVAPEYEIGGSTLQDWQTNNMQRLNPIMKIRSHGYVIFGQSTLYTTLNTKPLQVSAFQELGIRITANEIKRAIFNISLVLAFNHNNLKTWNEFRGQLDPILSQIQADGGITDYQIKMDEDVMTADDVNQNKIVGVVRVSVARAAEDFNISLELEPQSVTFSEDLSEFTI